MSSITISDLIRVIKTSLDVPVQRNKGGSDFFAPKRKNRKIDYTKIFTLLPQELRNIIEPLAQERGMLSQAHKNALILYLQHQWERIAIIDPELYFTSSTDHPYQLNIALAKLFFTDDYVRTLLHISGVRHVSFHTLLIPSAKNICSISLEPFDDTLENLYYLDGHIVNILEILDNLNSHKIFTNPYDRKQLLPEKTIATLCNCLLYREKTMSAIFPVICNSYGISPEIYQACSTAELKALIQIANYSLVKPDDLMHLFKTLLPACSSTDTTDNFEQGIKAFLEFQALLTTHPDHEKIVSLQNYVSGKAIRDMINSIHANNTCLSETADNICTILLSTAQILNVFTNYFDSNFTDFPDQLVTIPKPAVNAAATITSEIWETEEAIMMTPYLSSRP